MTGESVDGGEQSMQQSIDAIDQGWVETADGSAEPAMFFVSSGWLVSSSPDGERDPEWFGLASVASLDALGSPQGGVQAVELTMDDGRHMLAGWHELFCSQVVDLLVATLASTTAPPEPVAPAPPVVPAPPVAAAPPVVPVASMPPADSPGPTPEDRPVTRPSAEAPPRSATTEPPGASHPLDLAAAALVLEDVTYLGGYPGEDKKRKGCTATLTREDIEVSGPKGIRFRVTWEVVRSLEAQNADEARFRMNTKIHRDATALVLECDQGVTLLLEARDCPTIPLRGAIAQLIDGLPVVVV